jgi:hypothetical protein
VQGEAARRPPEARPSNGRRSPQKGDTVSDSDELDYHCLSRSVPVSVTTSHSYCHYLELGLALEFMTKKTY